MKAYTYFGSFSLHLRNYKYVRTERKYILKKCEFFFEAKKYVNHFKLRRILTIMDENPLNIVLSSIEKWGALEELAYLYWSGTNFFPELKRSGELYRRVWILKRLSRSVDSNCIEKPFWNLVLR